jgi:hypothetical protein
MRMVSTHLRYSGAPYTLARASWSCAYTRAMFLVNSASADKTILYDWGQPLPLLMAFRHFRD